MGLPNTAALLSGDLADRTLQDESSAQAENRAQVTDFASNKTEQDLKADLKTSEPAVDLAGGSGVLADATASVALPDPADTSDAAILARAQAGDHHAFVKTRTGFRDRCGREIEIDVVRDEQIEFAIAIVVDPRSAGRELVRAPEPR